MKKVAIFLLSMIMACAYIPAIYAQPDAYITLFADIDYNKILVSGKTESNMDISIAILKPGKTIEDMSNATASTFNDIFLYTKVIKSDASGNYNDEICVALNEDRRYYTVFVSTRNAENHTTVQAGKARALYVSDEESSENLTFKTIDEAKAYIASNPVYECDTYVFIKGGLYEITSPIVFEEKDSGGENSRIIYRSYDDDEVTITAGKRLDINKFAMVTDFEILSRLPSESRGKVMQMNLAEQGITREEIDFTSKFTSITAGQDLRPPRIYLNNHEQKIARYPNVGYKTIVGAIDSTARVIDRNPDYGGRIVTDIDNLGRWEKAAENGNLFIEGYFMYRWHGEWAKISAIDETERSLTLSCSANYGISETRGLGWAAVNLLEEIDIPGEWYIEPGTMTLYYYPPYTLTDNDVFEITSVNKNLVTMNNVSNITFEDINFEKSGSDYTQRLDSVDGGNGIYMNNVDNITIKNCRFEDIGMCGIYACGTNISITDSVFCNTGFDGVCISGGDRSSLKGSGNIISNCHFDSNGMGTDSNQYGGIRILADSVGCTVRNNVFHNMKNSAIRYLGNEHDISYNEIYNTNMLTGDAGAIYTGRSFTSVGTQIKYNLFHDIGGYFGNSDSDFVGAIYLDDFQAGNTIINNLMCFDGREGTRGIMCNGANFSTILNNTVVNAKTALVMSGTSSDSKYYDVSQQRQTLSEVDYLNEPYISKYPYIKTLDEMSQPGAAWIYQNKVHTNLSVSCETPLKISEKQKADIALGNVVDAPKALDNTDIFVNPDEYDYRIKADAISNYSLSENLLSENNFDINSIGFTSNHSIYKDMEFELVYPADNESNIDSSSAKLLWNKSKFADGYKYIVAKDAEFKDIAAKGEVYDNYVEVYNLEADTEYYWQVTAKNISRQNQTTIMSDVRSFKTSAASITENDGKVQYTIKNNSNQDLNYYAIKAVKNIGTNIIEEVEIKKGTLLQSGIAEDEFEVNHSPADQYEEVYIWTEDFKPICTKRIIIE